MPLTIDTAASVLKKETATQHGDAETLLHSKLLALKTREDYTAILRTFYGYFSQVEKLVSLVITQDDLFDIKERRNSSLILEDLASLGYRDPVPLCKDLPSIRTKAGAFGALYVLEGS